MSESFCDFDEEQEKIRKINKTTNKFKTFFILETSGANFCNKQVQIILDISFESICFVSKTLVFPDIFFKIRRF